MPDEHSKFFSPSSGGRLLTCPGSSKASEGIPDQKTIFSNEGSDAHTLAELRLKTNLGIKCDLKIENLTWYSKEMEDYITDYVSYVQEKIARVKETCKDPVVLVEQKVSAKKYDDNLYGTTDVSIIADKHLTIIDLKYGKGVQVFAKENVQEMIYGICCLETFGDLYDIEEIELCIFQPRLNSVSEWTVTANELYTWAEEVLKPGIQKIRDGVEEFHPSKYCVFCKAKPLCKALRDKNLELAKHEFRPPFLMDDDEIEEVLDKYDEFTNWINSVKEYAVDDAIHGKHYKNWKLVEGRSVRKYTDEKKVAERVKDAGYEPYESKLLSITDMTFMLGKSKFNELLNDLLIKPRGKLTLVFRDDKRQEISSAEIDFSDKENK